MNFFQIVFTQHLLIVVLISVLPQIAPAQNCLPNGLTITTQQQIDQFSTIYPGCVEISGDLIISGNTDTEIQSLAGLDQITTIDGGLSIANNNQLVDLSGLENLQSLAGNLLIFDNENLQSIEALVNLQTIRGVLSIGKNDALTSLNGLDNIILGITDLRIFANPMLSECSLSNLCAYLSNGGFHSIVSNSIGCSGTNEVRAICLQQSPCSRSVLNVNINPILDGDYQAINLLFSSESVPNNGNVEFTAGDMIELGIGFEVGIGAIFSAMLEECGL